ncbi:thioredoxin-disulfide reductase [uncultured Ruthenibacterium sp.]|uniref:thioredoxin-disulfide reductase n=1 Tax=uncultured Ruthenibacterium sp. TaxID=1905347 RepID=UPI00349E6119
MDVKTYDLVIVGGGPGGYTAALYAVRAGLSTLVIEKLSPGGQMATTSWIDNYPGFEQGVDGFELGQQMQRGAERFGAQTLYAEVTGLSLAENPKRLQTSEGEIQAGAVIIATGAAPRPLGLPEEVTYQGRGVAYCATCDGMFYKDKVVAVAGGGNSAAEDALTLAKLCKKVYLVHRREKLRAVKSYQELLEQADSVEFVWNRKISGLVGEKKLEGLKVENVQTGESELLPVDGLFVAIGRIPNTELVKGQIQVDEQGYIVADETTRTSLAGVFAVGDVRTKPLRQVVTAVADGAVAVKYAQEFLDSLS